MTTTEPNGTAPRPSPTQDDQSAVAALLADPASYPHQPASVERIDTHAAIVFLAGPFAYKLKRAVRYPFMDLSTLEKRRRVCLRELEINRRTAAQLYLDVLPITRDSGGQLHLAGHGPAVEWVLRMQRFDQDAIFDRLAVKGALTPSLMRDLADAIVSFHQAAEIRRAPSNVEELARVVRDIVASLEGNAELFEPLRAAALSVRLRAVLEDARPLLQRRQEEGLVRLCHGDLHLRNIVLLDGRPTLFDAIEFDDVIATCDLLYDLAFLLMDLEHRGMRRLANAVFNRYMTSVEDLSGLALLPLFLALRAGIRAMVAALEVPTHDTAADRDSAAAEAQAYFELTAALIDPPSPKLLAVGGLSGTGKSSLAAALAPDLGGPPGALHLRSDVLRKQLFGLDETQPLSPEAYRPEVSQQVYDRILSRARVALIAGQAVVADAVYARPEERAAIEAVARESGLSFTGLWLEAPGTALKERVDTRHGDASDADAAVVEKQLHYDLGDITWHRLDAARPLDEVAAAARHVLSAARRPA